MESRMITRRIFLTITVIMMLVLFLFQFTGIIRRKYNDYENNSYKADTETNLKASDEYRVLTSESDVLSASNRYIVYIGNADDDYGRTVYQWCRFTKKNMITYADITKYELRGWNKPEMVIVDSNYMDFSTQMDALEAISNAGVNVTMCTLPSYDITRKSQRFMDYCGIENIARRVSASGLRIFDDFLIGGEIWFNEDNDTDGTYSDITLSIPWYVTTTGTKTYMAAELSDEEYKDIDNENQPSLVWRKRWNDSYVFCINGDFIKNISGIGILSAIAYEAKDYDIYPAIDAQTYVVANFPYLSNENESQIRKYYSRTTDSFLENVIWPDLSNLSSKVAVKFTFMAAPQLNYSDKISVSVSELDYFFRLIKEQNSETGLTTARDSWETIEDKLDADNGIYKNYVGSYEFLSIFLKKDELDDVKNSKNEILDSVKTYVTGSDEYNENNLFSYVDNDKLLIETPVSSTKYSFGRDYITRCLNTALVYSNMDIDIMNMYYPEDEDSLWNKYIKEVSSATENLTVTSRKFSKCTVSELDKRVREMLSLDYSYRQEGDILIVDIKGNQETSRFVLRTHKKAIKSISGGTITMLEEGTYIITTTEKQIHITL